MFLPEMLSISIDLNSVRFSVGSSRIIRLEKKPLHTLGLEVSGGNMLGIYVTELSEDSVLKATGLRIGDRLLKVMKTPNAHTKKIKFNLLTLPTFMWPFLMKRGNGKNLNAF